MNFDDEELLKSPEEVIELYFCDICSEEIKPGDKFLEVRGYEGPKRVRNDGNVPGLDVIRTTSLEYIHLKHALYIQA